MPKGSAQSTLRLTRNTPCYQAIEQKVDALWEQHGDDHLSWPTPAHIAREFEENLIPFTPNHMNKGRDLIRRLIAKKFVENGQSINCFLF